uniref:DNA-directed RNA polymerase n=1 Tax=viral metagenome TaxID=1070528 RepID=A0A6C0L395_9ZZZZ|tara:strand:+ start:13397 stop:13657 length:261 start_codon:yes stop_codon:yes gene_type:complete
MLIPVRCFTCGSVIGDKWNPFVEGIVQKKEQSKEKVTSELDIQYIQVTEDGSVKKSIEGEMLDDLELHKYCCRRMFLGNVHLISYI